MPGIVWVSRVHPCDHNDPEEWAIISNAHCTAGEGPGLSGSKAHSPPSHPVATSTVHKDVTACLTNRVLSHQLTHMQNGRKYKMLSPEQFVQKQT